MPRTLSQTPAAIAARARRAAAATATTPEVVTPTTTPVVTEEFQTVLDTVMAHAATCGRLDCGHLGKSASQAVRRAIILYVAEGTGLTLDLTHENSEVTAVYGILSSTRHARPVYTRGRTARGGQGYVPTTPGLTLVMPNAFGIRLTTQRVETFSAMLAGMSASQISAMRHRDIETIKSHAGYLRRCTSAHDSVSALVALVRAGRLTDRAIVVTEPDTDPNA